jgi:5-hydroxyisourate hydrolase-like protein (transthyretin family)
MHSLNAKRPKFSFRAFTLLVFGFGVTPALLCQTGTDTPVAPLRTHSLGGTVLNSVTGEPIRRAMVQAAATNSTQVRAVLTDSEGRFQFSALPESEITVLARKPGYFSGTDLNPYDFQPETVHLVDDTASLTLTLLPEAIVTGHVATVKGDPIDDTSVRIFREVISNGYRHWEAGAQVTTEEDGHFRMAGLRPGRYLLAAGPSLPTVRVLLSRGVRKEGFGTMFYPGVPDMDAATPLALAGGQQVTADLALKLEPAFQVSGTLVGFSAGSGAALQFASKSGEVVPSPVEVDMQTGKFHGVIFGGSYILQARGADSGGRLFASDLPLIVTGDLEGITLPLSASINLPVNVEIRPSSNSPQQLALANFLPARDVAASSVRLISSDLRIDNIEYQAEKGKDGAMTFHNLLPGQYSVDVTTTAPWYVRSATSGTVDLLREELTVGAGRRPDPLEITLRDDGARLKGSILVGGEAADGWVLVCADQQLLTNARTALISPGAGFEFVGLAPGEYKVLAFDRETFAALEFRNPEVLAPYLPRAATVTLHPGAEATLNIERQETQK